METDVTTEDQLAELVQRQAGKIEELIEQRNLGDHEFERLQSLIEEKDEEIDQLRVQLAGCGVAALGGTSDSQICKQGQYGWSASYQETLDLRLKYEALTAQVERLGEGLRKLEWDGDDRCPVCRQMKIDSPLARTVGRSECIDHKPDCWLNNLLSPEVKE